MAVSARPALPSTRSTSGNCLMTRSVTCKQLLRLGDGDAGHGGGHVEERALVERRHELGAQAHGRPERSREAAPTAVPMTTHFRRSDQAQTGW